MLRGELGERLNAAQKVGRVWSLWLASPVCACSMASRGDVKVSVEAFKFFGAEYPELSFETEVGSLSLLRQLPGLLRRAAEEFPGRAIDYGDSYTVIVDNLEPRLRPGDVREARARRRRPPPRDARGQPRGAQGAEEGRQGGGARGEARRRQAGEAQDVRRHRSRR